MGRESNRELERELEAGWDEPGQVERLDDLVENYLLSRAAELSDRQVRNRDALLSLIHTYAQVELLRRLIQDPTNFNLKEIKELYRSTLVVEQSDAADKARGSGFLELLQQMPQTDQDRLTAALTEEAQRRREIGA